MREEIIKLLETKNIGSFCGYLKSKNGINHREYINNNIPSDILDEPMSIKLYYFINDIKETIICGCGKHRSYIGFKNKPEAIRFVWNFKWYTTENTSIPCYNCTRKKFLTPYTITAI